MKKITFILAIALLAIIAYSCGKPMRSQTVGGEVTGISMMAWDEPTPYGMALIKRGSLKIGSEEKDSLWGINDPSRDISIDAFWMDQTEVSNSKYVKFVHRLRDTIIRER